jgi:hypothetical protein
MPQAFNKLTLNFPQTFRVTHSFAEQSVTPYIRSNSKSRLSRDAAEYKS